LSVKGRSNTQKTKEANTFLHWEFFMLSLDECKVVLQFLKDKQITPDVITYTTLISKLTNLKDAREMLKTMKEVGIQPNNVTYGQLLKKADGFKEAMNVLNEMVDKEHLTPDLLHLSTLLGKAESPQDARIVEELRRQYGLDTNEIYANKLRIKQ
jgi:hypothetical protein